MLETTHLLRDLSDQERLMFQNEFNTRRKEVSTAVLLTVFLGGFGAHRFYLGNTGLGVLYIAFCWTFIPVGVALVELFLMPKRVRRHNSEVATEVVSQIKALRRN